MLTETRVATTQTPRGRTFMPVFPLNSVLFPDGVLPLRIFEPRYLELVAHCLRDDECFVVSLIVTGSENGEAEFHPVGTTARIRDWDQGRDGCLHVECLGEQRAHIHSHEVRRNGLYVADIEVMPKPERTALPLRHRRLAALIADNLAAIKNCASDTVRLDDANWLADRLCELLPLSLTDRQAMLEIDDPLVRLDMLHRLLPVMARAG